MCKAMKIVTQMSVALVLLLASTSFAEDPETRKIYFQGEAIELTPRADRLAVRFGQDVAAPQKKSILEDKHGITTAAVRESFTNPRIDVVTVEAADIAQVLRDAHKMMQDADIEYATPVFRSYDIDLIPTGELFVQLTDQAGDDAIGAIKQQFNLEQVKKTVWRDGNYLLRTTAQSRNDVFAICEQILERDDVEFSQPNFIRRLKPMDAPNDPLFGSQWGLHNVAQTLPNGNEDCDADAPEGWCIEKGCAEVIIAIIDEGCDLAHPDYASKLVAGYDFTDGDADCTPSGNDAHGTACAGIAAANTDNGQGIAGVNWHARIMPIRIAYRQSGIWVTTDQWQSDGIAWAYQNGADVLSNSWGGGPSSAQVHAAIRDAVIHGRNGKGAVVAFAAGNSNVAPPAYPGRHPESFCVGATSPCDESKSGTSCIAENCFDCDSCNNLECWGSNYGDEVDVAAPGVLIPTSDISGPAGYCPGLPPDPIGPPPLPCDPSIPPCTPPPRDDCSAGDDYIMNFGGTSAATPFVAGLASLVICKYPDYTALEIQARIEQTCDKVGGYAYSAATGRSFELGHGRVNIYRALSGKPQVELGPLPDFPSVYRDVSDQLAPYATTLHESAACEWLGKEYSPEKSKNDPDDPDGKQNVPNQDAFDDGVEFFPPYRPGETGTIRVTVSVEDSLSNRYGPDDLLYVNVWFDWEADGDWNDSYDWVVKNAQITTFGWYGAQSETFTYDFPVPAMDVGWHLQDGQAGKFMNVRTRLTYKQELFDANEDADFGEVEDDHFLNFVEMFDDEFNYYMDIANYGCTDWEWIDDNTAGTCHPPFRPDGLLHNGYMVAESYLLGNYINSGLRTPSFDLTELTRAFLEFEQSAVEGIIGEVRLYKNGIFNATLAYYPGVPCSACLQTPCMLNEIIDLTPWCGDDNGDIVLEFRTGPFPHACNPAHYQDWKIDNVVVWGDDIIDPATVAVNTAPQTETSNLIDWITPGDDGMLRQAETYNLRYGPKPIDAGNWRHALWVLKRMVGALPVPQMPGTPEFLLIEGLSPGLHHFSVRAMDEVTNISGIGAGGANNAPVQVAPGAIVVNAGALVSFIVTATDPDLDPLLMEVTMLPIPACAQPPSCMAYVDNGNNTGTFTWQTEAGDVGNHQVMFQATDPNGLNDVDVTMISVGMATPIGACCDGIGGCAEVTQLVCTNGNGSYQGDGTTCTPNPCGAPTGACCDPAGGCAIGTAAACGAAGGAYQGDNTVCLPGMCPATTGACCDPAGGCTIETAVDCGAAGGAYQGDNTPCLPGLCPVPTGACCDPTGGCALDTAVDCGLAGGVYQGDNSVCLPGLCPVPTGACCDPTGGCALDTAVDCGLAGGMYQGDNSVCLPGLCPVPTGACCDPAGVCTIETAADCGAAGGAYLGDNTGCLPGICSGPATGACCDPTGACAIETAADCGAAGGTYQGDNTVCLAGTCPAPIGPISFIMPPATYATGVMPVAVAAGDLDADGDEDLVVANRNSGTSSTVTILTNDGTGVFVGSDISIVGSPLEDIVLADLDGDGDLDLASASGAAVVNWNNNGSFGVWRMIGVGANPTAIVAADFDGDCTIDLATANSNPPGNNVAVVLNVDGVYYSPLTTLYAAGTNPVDLAAGDIDGDGDADLVVANASSADVSVLFNDGLGNFSAPLSFASGMPNCCLSAVALGDLDGDLDLDVVVTNGGDDKIAVLFNDGIGNLSAPTLITVGNFPADVVAADLDGDGDLDLVLTNTNSPYQVQVLANDGSGNFAPPLNFPLDPGPRRIAVANLDNSDGALDLAVALTGPDKVAVLINATDQDCNGNGIADQIEPSSSMSFNVTGTSSATFCTWRVHGTGFDIEGEFCVTAGAGGEAFATEIVEQINDTGCPGIRAEHLNGLAGGFSIIAPGNSLNFCIGTAPGVPGCCFPGAGTCSCNPDIEELLLVGDDCNGNGVDDVIDILNGTSQDQDGDGIPDECSSSSSADLDGDGDIDAADLAIILGSWGPCHLPCTPGPPGTTCLGDLNGDCDVNAMDLALVLGCWGQPSPCP